jgi:hypothetical protein
VSHALCLLFVLTKQSISNHSGYLTGRVVNVHHSVPPLFARSGIPTERICTAHHNCRLSDDVYYGAYPAPVSARLGETAPKESRNLMEMETQARLSVRDKAILKDMWVIVGFGLIMFLGGFGIWSLDNIYCSRLRGWRREIGLPWGVILEGHGWW